jgi:5-methylcytosine-specific restriction protein B
VLPVQPGWYDQSGLLGHVSVLHDSVYRGTPFLTLLQRASENPSEVHVVILDEMNLSHPEQYMAQLLSGMELSGNIELHTLKEEDVGVPKRIAYPSNLVIIGTINMDETTHGLSDKVLDRAFTMEFARTPVGTHPAWHDESGIPTALRERSVEVLKALDEALAPCRLNFGHRTEADIRGYLKARGGVDSALDEAVYAKVLPKLRGEDTKAFRTALVQVHGVCKAHALAKSAEKVAALQEDLNETGSARFWR